MPKFKPDQLREASTEIFKKLGASEKNAERISESLVLNNLVGHDSHGVIRIPQYTDKVQKGAVDPKAEIEIIKETNVSAIIDGNWNFGQVIAARGMELAMKKAKENNIGTVCLTHCNHLGRLGEYPMMAVKDNLIGMAVCNSGPPGGIVVPFGGKDPIFSTNPLAFAAPTGKHEPYLLDIATSMRAEGKVRVAYDKGKKVPQGWIIDEEGKPTKDPEDFYEKSEKEIKIKGSILPFGEHKGYGLAMMVDILGGALSGAGVTTLPEYEGGNGTFMCALNIESFRPLDEFLDTMDRFIDKIKNVSPAPGFEEVLVPGEIELTTKAKREKVGIKVPEKTWQNIKNVADELEVDLEKFL